METAESRGQRPQHDSETGASLIQVHGVHGDIRNVQAVREPRVLRPQHGGQAGDGQEDAVRLCSQKRYTA